MGMKVGATLNGVRACAAALPGTAKPAALPAASKVALRRSCLRLVDFICSPPVSSTPFGARLGSRHNARNRRRRGAFDLWNLYRLPGLCIPAAEAPTAFAFAHFYLVRVIGTTMLLARSQGEKCAGAASLSFPE